MNFLLEKNEFFYIEHSYSCAVPGYLIVSPTVSVKSIADLPKAFQNQIGLSLATANKLIEDVINPLKIYCAQFGEEWNQSHFHIFPRTTSLTVEYLKVYPEQKELIHGPVMFDWARTKYKYNKEKVWSIVSPIILEMRKRIKSGSQNGTQFAFT